MTCDSLKKFMQNQIWNIPKLLLKVLTEKFLTPGPYCMKLTINGNFAFNGNYHGNKTP